jgi:hypothetical protein
VCGGRAFTEPYAVSRWLDELFRPNYDSSEPTGALEPQPWWLPRPDLVIITGGAKGVDSAAREWCIINGVKHQEYAADWALYGGAAGPIRNKRMLKEGKPDMVLAFSGGRGTADMVEQARQAKVPVMEIF